MMIVSAHKLVLSASSQFFKNLLKKSTHSNPLVYLPGVKSVHLNYIIDYIIYFFTPHTCFGITLTRCVSHGVVQCCGCVHRRHGYAKAVHSISGRLEICHPKARCWNHRLCHDYLSSGQLIDWSCDNFFHYWTKILTWKIKSHFILGTVIKDL